MPDASLSQRQDEDYQFASDDDLELDTASSVKPPQIDSGRPG